MASQSLSNSSETVVEVDKGTSLVGVVSSVYIYAAPRGDKVSIKFNGEEVPLTGKSFTYFTMLALSRGVKDGWVHKEELEPGLNQSKNIYRMKTELKKELASLVGVSCPEIENNGAGSYRLGVAPNIISFDEGNIRAYGDTTLNDRLDLILKG